MNERISVPQKNIEKFNQVLLYTLSKVGGKPNVGKTVLCKLLYFMDFDYYELYEEQFMGLEYTKKQFGPVPTDFDQLIDRMKANNLIEEVHSKRFAKEQTKYLPLVDCDPGIFSGRELEHMEKELARLSDKSASEISEYSHKDVPWITAEEGKSLDYEAVFYRNELTSLRNYDD